MLNSELKPEYDVNVVGAQVAGATVAALLGDAAREVLLVDASALPSPTLSTHFFRGGGKVGVLDRLRVLDQVLAPGSPPLVHEYVYPSGGEESMEGPRQNPGAAGYCHSVRRAPLDHLLLQRGSPPSSQGLVWQCGKANLVNTLNR